MRMRATMTISCVGLALSAGNVAAQEDPEFEYEDPSEAEEVDEVTWGAKAQGSLVNTTGNSRTTTVSGGTKISRRGPSDKFQLDGNIAYVRASVLTADDADGSGTIDDASEIVRNEQVTSQAWSVLGRYDRFLTKRNSLYAAGLAGADRPAGQAFAGGGQLGYSRVILSSDGHELTGEAGYDFSYESFVAAGDGVAIHSGRAFLGYTGKLTGDTEAAASAEALTNFNPLTKPTGEVDAFGDTRIRGSLAITTQLFDDISFRGGFTARYRSSPAPLPPLGIPYADGFVPEAESLDTTTELTLIVNFL